MSNDLYYPRPRHEDYELARLVHDLQEADDDGFAEFMADPQAFVARYDLDDQAQKLVTSFDYDGLVKRGIHPMLSVQYMRRVEWNLKMAVKKETV
ncbi:hypothetical protein [Mycolicibacterium goodii]|uniref:Extradiol ring-cleavage dioxygenase LigAB LigA subunit domain-containing protein n=1 Tax=Mycolicibacterium goodii TaxID=134601 RepID=A0ABS6HGG8_MYCGD|nr:hypothetical protein [Mycolicibacterium goodii]OKH73767.1 hypothetical protein EB74_16735 [Mycobacterium sp. SWH-M5]MBU8809367.1 hypothetical protein [Mycolicibacterium goodii]MBU8816574.1 hypothetical protein [Mycolicibacterium goodii]MBU8821736.1 hypothetical protein [Mycolicibacterium goodii]MBU8831687.1 hypothetical protein [Mycolicibacterium goodii]